MQMRDLIVVIPGIMGSVLERGGAPVWSPGPGMLSKLLSRGKWLDDLSLPAHDDPTAPFAADDIIPTRLLESQAIIPGWHLIDGYSELDATLRRTFSGLVEGDPLNAPARLDGRQSSAAVPNYYRFAYDFRRDLRASAMRLHDMLTVALAARRKRSPEAKVLFVAHSMGGLLARYWIEGVDPRTGDDFGGWQHTRELLTLGTPYRGALDAVVNLSNGMDIPFVDFRSAMATMPGVHQLIAWYPSVLDSRAVGDKGWHHPKDLNLPGVSRAIAQDAYEFYESIDAGASRHRESDDYPISHLVPLIGHGHSTTNALELTDDLGLIELSEPPPDFTEYTQGDGTVPAASAIPRDYESDHSRFRYAHQKHGSLQVDRKLLRAEISRRWRFMQAPEAGAAAGFDEPVVEPSSPTVTHPSVIGEHVGTDVEIRLADRDTGSLLISQLGGETNDVHEIREDQSFTVCLPAGEYRLDLKAEGATVSSGLMVLPAAS